MPNWKKIIVSGSNASLNTLFANSVTASLQGTASYALSASYAPSSPSVSSSYAETASNIPFSGLKSAISSSIINNLDYSQIWQWNSLSSNTGLKLFSNSTAATNSFDKNQTLLEIELSGSNFIDNQITYGVKILNQHTGLNSHNIGMYLNAIGGDLNTSLLVEGNIRLSPDTNSEIIIDSVNNNVLLGDTQTLYNSHYISIEDPNQIIKLNSPAGKIEIGDISGSGAVNNTWIKLNDYTRKINFSGISTFIDPITGSISNAITSSYALTASYALNGGSGGGGSTDILMIQVFS